MRGVGARDLYAATRCRPDHAVVFDGVAADLVAHGFALSNNKSRFIYTVYLLLKQKIKKQIVVELVHLSIGFV